MEAAAPAPAPAPPAVVLYTVAPGSDLFSLYGHSVLCVEGADASGALLSGAAPQAETAGDATCYDYGVARADGAFDLVWGSIRGEALFVPTVVKRSVMLTSFQNEERAIWKQPLPLAPEARTKMAVELDAAASGKHGYVYDPRFANCTTKLRDAIDEAAGGKLHAGMDAVHAGPTFRAMWEEGLSGQMGPLAVTELVLGAGVDRPPTEWERLLLPSALREAVEKQLGVAPSSVYSPSQGAHVQTSASAGRVALVSLGLMLAVALVVAHRGARATSARRARTVAGVVLSLLGLVVWSVALLSAYRELRWNAALFVLVPFDVAIVRLQGVRLVRYLEARLGSIALFFVLGLAGVVRPLASLALLAALPLATTYAFARRAGAAAFVTLRASAASLSNRPG